MKKIMQYIIVGFGLIVATLVFLKVHPENWLKTTGDVVTLSELVENTQTDYTGYIADSGIPLIQSLEEFDKLLAIRGYYAVVAPTDIVATGIYVKMPWWKPHYATGTKQAYKNKKEPSVTTNHYYDTQYGYSQYYLIQLPDGAYLPALMDRKFADALAKGETVTLPIGHKAGKLEAASDLLSPIFQKYGVTEKYTLYTCNNDRYVKNELTATILSAVIAIGVFAVLMIVATLVFRKVFTND